MTMTLVAGAQSTTDGAISGTVSDIQGAVVPNASVTVRNIGTNAQQTTTSDATGFFRVLHLQPAAYEVSVTTTGFAPFKASNVTVNIGTTTELSAHLKPAGSAETVEVVAQAPQVNTSSAEFAPVVDETQIKNLPINGGRWSSFVLLTPGVVNDSSGFGLVSFRGMSTLQNNNTVDGADNNQAFFAEERGRTRAGYSTAKAAVQEFQVNTSNYSVEFGRAVGGVVNTVTKSGTNHLHGEAYFFDRDNNWGATNPFTTLTVPTSTVGVFDTKAYKPKDWRKMIGSGIGGAIVKDKLFFFFAYDFYKRNFPGLSVASNPKSFFAAPGCYTTTKNPTPGQLCDSDSTIGTLSSRVYGSNTVAKNALATKLYQDDLTALLTTSGPNSREGAQYIYLPKIDWQINAKNHLSFVVNRMNWDSPAGIQTQASNTNGRQSFGNDYVRVFWGVVKLNTSITSNMVNEVRVQYGRDFEYQKNQTPTDYEVNNLVKSALFPAYTNPLGLPPELLINNGWNLGTANFLNRTKFPDEYRQQYADTMSWAHGKHMFKFGGDFTHVSDTSENLRFQYAGYNYSGSTGLLDYFSDLNKAKSCGTAAAPTDCYGGNYSQAFGPLGFKFTTNDYGFFGEDSWRALPRLTLTLGLRWDYQQLPETFKNLVNPLVPETAKMPSDKNNFGPRVGFAYDPWGDGKTSIRGGYALTYGRTINSTIYNALTNTGVVGSQSLYQISKTSPCAPVFPQIYATEAAMAAAGCTPARSVVYFDKNFQQPMVHNISFSLEHQLTPSTALQMSYLGSFGRHLPVFVDRNIDPASKVTNTYTVCGVNNGSATDLSSCGKPGNGPVQATTVSAPFYTKRKDTNFGALTDVVTDTDSTYHAMALQLNRRMSKHFMYNANFTWSHAIDYGQNNTTFSSANSVLDPFNLEAEKGNSNQNVPLRFVLNAVMESPWKLNGLLGKLTNDWQLAPMMQWQSGLPYSAKTSGTPGACPAAPAVCNFGQPLGGFSGNGGINGTNGDFRLYGYRNQFRQPATQVWDMKLTKGVKINERFSTEFSGEVFNMFNHVNYTSVQTTSYFIGTSGKTGLAGVIAPNVRTLTFNSNPDGSPVFGVPSNANSNFAYSPRQVQLGVKVKF